MKIDQLAYYCVNDQAANMLKATFGLENAFWQKDIVTATSSVRGGAPKINIAELQFNYDLGIELEILRYIEGPSWHDRDQSVMGRSMFISHQGAHLAPGEDFPPMPFAKLVQETITQEHTSPYLTTGPGAGRHYHYRIYELGPQNYFKIIKRIEP